MNNKIHILILFLLAGILFSSEDTNTPIGVIYPEKFKAKISGYINTELIYDEDKVVATSGGNQLLEDEASSYLAITASDQDPTMTIDLYPPDNHERRHDIISIAIKTKTSKP